MQKTYYHDEFNDIVVEVNSELVISDLWDYPKPVDLSTIETYRTVNKRRPVSSLVWPTIVTILGVVLALSLSIGIGAGKTSPLHLILPTVFVLFGIARWVQFLRTPVSELFITTSDGRSGLLYMSRHPPTFQNFRDALILALEENTDFPADQLGNDQSP